MGSVPWGLCIARFFCGIDPRTAGSKSIGATNVSRLCGFRWGVATLCCDLLKGTVPVALALALDLLRLILQVELRKIFNIKLAFL